MNINDGVIANGTPLHIYDEDGNWLFVGNRVRFIYMHTERHGDGWNEPHEEFREEREAVGEIRMTARRGAYIVRQGRCYPIGRSRKMWRLASE